MTLPAARIAASSARRTSGKTGSLHSLTKADITKRLGVRPVDCYADSDQKVRYEWRFTIEGVECAIWDWHAPAKGNTTWSCSGSPLLMAVVFGDNYRQGAF